MGSYAGDVVVDFDALSPFGLFHIHGPTGAGKSSLLDALCFALYGEIPAPRSADKLRSDHAPLATQATATLEFSAQGNDYRVTRTPAQDRPKSRGEGVRRDWAKATLLKRVGNDWQPVSSVVLEVDTAIKELIGLDANQFMQVVVLPQGAFARALQARADDREKLLRTLFHTERFEVYTERLRARAELAANHYAAEEQAVGHWAGRVYELCSALGITLAHADSERDGELQQMATATHDARALLAGERARLLEAQRRSDVLDEQLQTVRLDTERWQRRVGAQTRLAALDESANEVQLIGIELERADRVAPLGPLYRAHLANQRAAVEAAGARAAAQSAVAALGNDLDWDDTLRSAVAEVSDDCGELWSQLRAAETDTHALGSAKLAFNRQHSLVNAAQVKLSQLSQQLDLGHQQLDALSDQRVDLEREISTVRQSADLRDRLQADVSRLADQCEAGQKLVEQRRLLDSAELQLRAASERTLDLQQRYLDLLQRRLETMASELARGLKDGDPCRVCGSLDHPQPAASDDIVDEKAVAQAKAEWSNAQSKSQLATNAVAAQQAACNRLVALAGAAVDDLGAAKRQLDDMRTQLANATQDLERCNDLQKQLASLTTQVQVLNDKQQSVHNAVIEAQTEVTTARDELARVQAENPDVDFAAIDVDGRLKLLTKLSSLIGSFERAQHNEQMCSQQRAESAAQLRQEMDAAGMSDVDSGELSLQMRDDNQRELMREQVDRWNHARSAAQQILDDPTHQTITEAPDLVGTQQRAQTARNQTQELVASVSRLETQVDELVDLVDRLANSHESLAPLRAERDRLTTLAQLCDGKQSNARRISLERYVLASYLEEVADAASIRLQLMSAGRYRLRHSDVLAKRKAASGLSLLVSDSYTGTEREVSTLSGGEMFLASLSLALGLADVVQQHAGGVAIEALFVDEGFGSLDADTLDLAMAELDRLREGGRLVGVISHVDALRSRIPVGIEVVKGAEGSTIKVTSDVDGALAV